jgi:hypothetical protein
MPKIFPDFGKFSIASKMLTSSVFIALLTTLNTTAALSQPATPPPATPSPTPSTQEQPTKAIAEKLVGQWETKDPGVPVTLTFIFSPEGKLFIYSPNSPEAVAVEFTYRIDTAPQPKPIHLDISIPGRKEPVLTIFDFTADGKLRLQLENTNPGKSRPTDFSEQPTLFTKVSESTKLPDNVKVIQPTL